MAPGEYQVYLPGSFAWGWDGYSWEVCFAGKFPWLIRIDAPAGVVYEVAYSPDGKRWERLAAAGNVSDRALAETRRSVRTLAGLLSRTGGGTDPYPVDVEIHMVVNAIRGILLSDGLRPPFAARLVRQIKGRVWRTLYPNSTDGSSLRKCLNRIEDRSGFTWDDLLDLAARDQ